MNHIRKYKLSFRNRNPAVLRNIFWIIGILLLGCGTWWLVNYAKAGYQLYTQHEALVTASNEQRDNAMADVILAMEMLSGKRPVMTADGLRVAKIEWQDVELIRGLR